MCSEFRATWFALIYSAKKSCVKKYIYSNTIHIIFSLYVVVFWLGGWPGACPNTLFLFSNFFIGKGLFGISFVVIFEVGILVIFEYCCWIPLLWVIHKPWEGGENGFWMGWGELLPIMYLLCYSIITKNN